MKLFLTILALSLTACGEPPKPLDEGDAPPQAVQNPHREGGGAGPLDAGSLGEMPQDSTHAAFASPGSASNPHGSGAVAGEAYGGVVRLTGERATRRDAYLFVSVVPAGTSMPLCFDRLDLSEESLGEMDGDVRIVPFSYTSCAPHDGDVELKVQFDIDGYVETKQEGSLVGRFPVERGDTQIDVTLE